MKNYLFYLTITIISSFFPVNVWAQDISDNDAKKTALVIIDIQEFYFPGGSVPLHNPEKATEKAKVLLESCRSKGVTIIHVRHNARSGADIHELVSPLEKEKVISKDKANAFVNTDLQQYLEENKIKNLILCGMQTHMCLEAATRAASDFGYNCTVIQDACATRDLKFGDLVIKADDVHYSTLKTLDRTYAKVTNLEEFLDTLK